MSPKKQPTPPTSNEVAVIVLTLLVVTAILAFLAIRGRTTPPPAKPQQQEEPLLFISKAIAQGADSLQLTETVRKICQRADIPENWLMCLVHMESKWKPSQSNLAGSGATGLIQFMPATAAANGYTTAQIKQMSITEQLPLIDKYLQGEIATHGGFYSFTDLYLAVLYPSARPYLKAKEFNRIVFPRGTTMYLQNRGLDFDNSGEVTIRDISRYLRNKYPQLHANIPQPHTKER